MNNRKRTKIIFSNPPALVREGLKSRGMFPLPLITLSNALDGEVEIENASPDLLANDVSPEFIIGLSGANWLALTCYQETMNQVMALAKIAKDSGKKVVVGGHHITLWGGQRVLEQIPYIDFAITDEGEVPLKMLIKGSKLELIPGIWWKINGKPTSNNLPAYVHDWTNQKPMIRGYSGFDYSELWRIQKRTGYRRPFSVMAFRGCSYAHRTKKRCDFCAMPLADKLRCRSPKYFWDEVAWAVDKYNIDVLWEHSDSFLGCFEWLKEALPFRLKNAPPIWCYGRADEINKDTIGLIKEMGVEHVYIGVEGGSNRRLKEMKKGETLEQVLCAVRLCLDYSISVQLSFIFGFPGETPETFKDTVDFALVCKEMGVDDVVFHEFILRKGLRWFEVIAQKHPKMDRVVLDQGRLQEMFWHYFNPCLNREQVLKDVKEIVALFSKFELTAWNV